MKLNFDNVIKDGVEQIMENCQLAIGMTLKEAVEKQIPKKPYDVDEEYKTFDCPVCLSKLYADDDVQDCGYCCICGQKLLWEEKE